MTRCADLREAYLSAGALLATYVDVDERMTNDPTHPGDRGAQADALRARAFADALAAFRAAKAAFLGAVA